MPAVFPNDRWLPLAKAYYTAEILGILEKVHHPLFVAIHEQKRKMNSEQALTAFFVQHAGISAELFEKTFNSFTVDSKIRTAAMMTKHYGITGVPMIIVNGKYRLTSEKTNGYENMMKVIDHLIAKEHKVKVAVQTHSPVTFN
jgi:thiol:disulfide interchange protein DsbA